MSKERRFPVSIRRERLVSNTPLGVDHSWVGSETPEGKGASRFHEFSTQEKIHGLERKLFEYEEKLLSNEIALEENKRKLSVYAAEMFQKKEGKSRVFFAKLLPKGKDKGEPVRIQVPTDLIEEQRKLHATINELKQKIQELREMIRQLESRDSSKVKMN